jgi:hypothetical protein
MPSQASPVLPDCSQPRTPHQAGRPLQSRGMDSERKWRARTASGFPPRFQAWEPSLVRSHSEKLAALPATATTIFFLKTSDERCPFQSSECTAVFRVIEDASEFRRHDKDKQYCYSQQLQAHSGACYVQR